MQDIQQAFENYLSDIQQRDTFPVVRVKDVKDALIPQFIVEGQALSEVMRKIAQLIQEYRLRGLLERIKPGVYQYDAEGKPGQQAGTDLALGSDRSTQQAAPSDLARSFPAAPYLLADLASVATLARSPHLLISSIESANFESLHGLSF